MSGLGVGANSKSVSERLTGSDAGAKKLVDFERASLVWKELKREFVQMTNSDSMKTTRTDLKDGRYGGSLLKICSSLKSLSGKTQLRVGLKLS